MDEQQAFEAIRESGIRQGYDGDLYATFWRLSALIQNDPNTPDVTDEQLETEANALGLMMAGWPDDRAALDFQDPWHRIVALAIQMVRANGKVPDPITLTPLTYSEPLCADDPLSLLVEMAGVAIAPLPSATIH